MKSDFVKFVYENYDEYKTVQHDLIDIAVYFSERGLFSEYVAYLKHHFNNAFSDFDDVVEEVMAIKIAKSLSDRAVSVLCQVVNSPTKGGDIASKSGRSELFKHGLILKVASNHDLELTAANSLGLKVWNSFSIINYGSIK